MCRIAPESPAVESTFDSLSRGGGRPFGAPLGWKKRIASCGCAKGAKMDSLRTLSVLLMFEPSHGNRGDACNNFTQKLH
jgi:hypothetical protein